MVEASGNTSVSPALRGLYPQGQLELTHVSTSLMQPLVSRAGDLRLMLYTEGQLKVMCSFPCRENEDLGLDCTQSKAVGGLKTWFIQPR